MKPIVALILLIALNGGLHAETCTGADCAADAAKAEEFESNTDCCSYVTPEGVAMDGTDEGDARDAETSK